MEDIVILHEDNHIIVALKPQNMPCCEDESKDKDLLTALKEYIKVKYEKQGNVYLGLVHRLDRPTGGVMVFAKSSKAAARLSEQMQNGDFEKKYLTVLTNTPKRERETLRNYIKKNAINNMVYICTATDSGAKYAELDYRILDTKMGLSLAEVTLHTGRSHQIRVQMAGINCPLYGDMRYGGVNAKKGKLALWAYSLAFTHPVTKERLVFKVQPPEDISPWELFSTADILETAKPEA